MDQEMRQRVVLGSSALLIITISLIFAQVEFFRALIGLGVTGLGLVGVWEYYALMRAKGLNAPVRLGMAAAFFYLAITFFASQGVLHPYSQPVAFGAVVLVMWLFFLARGDHPLVVLPAALFGILYVAVGLGFAFNILYSSEAVWGHGKWWITFILATTVATDIGAYFIGKRWGRRRLVPRISPGKTWEGSVGGLVAGLAVGLFIWLFSSHPISFSAAFGCSLLLSVFTQVGDLAESLLKRDAQVKDSNTLPGLGGALDVVDGLLFTLPIGFFLSIL